MSLRLKAKSKLIVEMALSRKCTYLFKKIVKGVSLKCFW